MKNTSHYNDFSLEEKRVLLAQLLKEKASAPKFFPLSFAQQRLWYLNQLELDSTRYNIPAAVHLSGELNKTALEQSLNEIIRRHEALRTNFTTAEDQPVQVISSNLTLAVPVVDLQSLHKSEQQEQVQQLAIAETQHIFDLAQDVLVRAVLLQLGAKEYVLLLTMHHIVSDGWSVGILVRELTALYEAYGQNLPLPLCKIPIQYADFAVWQRQWLQGETLDSLLAYWKQQLANAPALLELPTDRPRPAIQTFQGAHQVFRLSKDLSEALTNLSQQEGVTLFMTLLAAFQILLSRYSGQTDILVGSPIANRNRAEIEGLIGFFVNTLVLRTNLDGNPSFQQLLGRVRKVALEAYAHQDLPFEQLVEKLQPVREPSYTPLFQVVFVLQNAPVEALELPGLTISYLEVNRKTSAFDISLGMESTEQGLVGSFEYNTNLFDDTTIQRMVGHFQTLLKSIVFDPTQEISKLSILTPAEQNQLLVEWNNTHVDYPKNICIHQLFEAQVERTPDATAIVFEEYQLTFKELNQRANQLAHHFSSLGVKVGELIAVYMDRSLEMIPALLGILKAGGAYVPLEPSFPKTRIQWILSSLKIHYIVTQSFHLQTFSSLKEQLSSLKHIICLETSQSSTSFTTDISSENSLRYQIWTPSHLYHLSKENLPSCASSDEIAYIIFTSGSTGTPKGVMVRHKPVINLIDWVNKTHKINSSDRVLFLTSLCFDLSVYDIFGLLAAGGSIRVVSSSDVRDPERLLNIINNENITFWDSAPAALQQLVPFFPSIQSIHSKSQIRLVFLSGDWIALSLPDQIKTNFPGVDVISLGGATEATVWSNYYPIQDVSSHWVSIPYGKPIQNAQYYILDRYFNLCPIGIPGELHIGGECLSSGYINEPTLTAQKFIPNPFSDEPGAHLYKTGDLARYLPDGNIEFLGRIDHQVKIRGFRIELGEIEAVLNQQPALLHAVVTAREDVPGDKRLVAYLVLNQDQISLVSELRHLLKQKLPEYMVPSAFVMLDALPLTPNGKVDLRNLPAPETTRLERSDTFIAPRDHLELQLARIWQKILNVSFVGVKDNFFDLGGHSLLVVSLMNQIKKQLKQSLPLTTIFEAGTIEQLAITLRQQQKSTKWSSWSPLVEIQPGNSKTPFFCVHPVGGTIFSYVNLARFLDQNQPFYGLQARGLDGEHEPCTKIEEMATHYIEALQFIQPKGPYLLGGWSMGGIVAFEMAQQLQAQGHKVALLALIDIGATDINSEPKTENEDNVALLINFAQDQGLSLKNLDISLDDFKELTFDDQIKYILEQAHQNNLLPPNVESEMLQSSLKVFRANAYAMNNYSPRTFVGHVTLFKASEGLTEHSQDRTMGWDKLVTEEVETYVIPGNHYTIFNPPHVEILAKYLEVCFEKVQTNSKE